jgi:hypothetical protein
MKDVRANWALIDKHNELTAKSNASLNPVHAYGNDCQMARLK